MREATDPYRGMQAYVRAARPRRTIRAAPRSACARAVRGRDASDDCGTSAEQRARRRSASRAGRSTRPSRAGRNRRWWDADADDYHAEHGDFLGDADFVWCPEGLREADARLLGDVARAPACWRSAAGAAPCARWLAAPGRAAGGARPLRRACCGTPRGRRRATGVAVPLVQADAAAAAVRATRAFDLACSAFGAVPFVADSARGDARGGPGAAARAAAGCSRSTHPMRWAFPDDPGPDGLTVAPVVLRPHARTSRSTTHGARRPTSSTTARSATGSASWSPPGFVLRRPGRAGVAGGPRRPCGASGRPLRGELFPGTAIFVCRRP